MIIGWVVRASIWTLLGGWLGSFGLFALVVAPTAFQVLPSQAAAGSLVAPVLAALHNYGIAAGLGLAVLGALSRGGWLVVALPLVLAGLCGFSEYWVTPAINEVQPHSFGASQDLEASQRFSHLHQLSRYLFGTVLLGVLALVVAHARPPAIPPAPDRGPQPGA